LVFWIGLAKGLVKKILNGFLLIIERGDDVAITGILDSDRVQPFRMRGDRPNFQRRIGNSVMAAKRLLKSNIKIEGGIERTGKGQIVNIKA
jgi:hypothetical protein